MDDDDTLKVIAFQFTVTSNAVKCTFFIIITVIAAVISSAFVGAAVQFKIQFISCHFFGFIFLRDLIGVPANVPGAGLCWTFSYWLWSSVPMVIKRQKELSKCYLSQLAACFQRCTNDVLNCYGKYARGDYWKLSLELKSSASSPLFSNAGNAMVESLWWNRMFGIDYCMSMSRFGSPRNKQFVSNQVSMRSNALAFEIHSPKCDFSMDFFQSNFVQSFIAVGPTVFNVNNGTSSFRSMSDDFKQSRKSNFSPFVIRRVQPSDTSFRRCNSINGFSRLFPVKIGIKNGILPLKIGLPFSNSLILCSFPFNI